MDTKSKTPQAVDFQRVLRALCVMGLNLNAVSLHANIARTSLRDYQNGTQPLHASGERLIILWCEMTGNHRDQVPRKPADLIPRRSHFPQKGALPSLA